ncbi:MAG: CoA-binding protein [Paracoccaceae bacterium]
MEYSAQLLTGILTRTKVIACVGLSLKPDRPSHMVAEFLQERGYRVIGVNPAYAGQTLFGEIIYADLAAIPSGIVIDMVDIFRRSDAVPEIVDDAIVDLPGLKTIWMQIGVEHSGAAAVAKAAGITVIQNRCPKIEYQRLGLG